MTVISSAEARPVARFQLLSRETSFWAIASMLFLLICASAAFGLSCRASDWAAWRWASRRT